MKWNLHPGLKIWKELPVARKSQSLAHVRLKVGSDGRVGHESNGVMARGEGSGGQLSLPCLCTHSLKEYPITAFNVLYYNFMIPAA